MNVFSETLELIKSKNIRITKQRLAFLEVIYNNHYTFHEIYEKLKEKGYSNLATLYNNIDFFIDNGVISKFYVNNVDYYELSINNPEHHSNGKIHFSCNKRNKIHEVNTGDFLDFLGEYPYFKNIDIKNVDLLVKGACKNGCRYPSTGVCRLDNNKKR